MRVYNVGNRIMNTYLYQGRDGYVMIDTGYENSYSKCSLTMKKLGIAWDDVKYIFLTHAHDDHAGFLKEVLDRHSGITCIMSSKAFPILLRGQNSFQGGCSSSFALFFCNFMKLFGKGDHRFPALDESYRSRFIEITEENIKEAEACLLGKILFTPGHTADSISLKVKNQIFCGDAAMNGFPSLHRVTIWVENKKEFENSWHVLFKENAQYLFPAHGKRFACSELKKHMTKMQQIKLYPLS